MHDIRHHLKAKELKEQHEKEREWEGVGQQENVDFYSPPGSEFQEARDFIDASIIEAKAKAAADRYRDRLENHDSDNDDDDFFDQVNKDEEEIEAALPFRKRPNLTPLQRSKLSWDEQFEVYGEIRRPSDEICRMLVERWEGEGIPPGIVEFWRTRHMECPAGLAKAERLWILYRKNRVRISVCHAKDRLIFILEK